MICPKCGFEQPESPECARCGVIVSRYKGPGAPPPPSPLLVGPVFGSPALAGAGTVYDGPAAVGGGTVYQGPPPGSPAPAPALRTFRGSFGVGQILGETFSIYVSNFLPFVLLTALVLAPAYLLEYFVAQQPQAVSLVVAGFKLLLLIVRILAPYVATGAITFGVFQQLQGKDTSVADCLKRGLSLLLPVFGLAFVQSLAVTGAMLACLVPGIILAVRWAVSIPAAVTEGTGVSASMERSSFLTDGLRWDVFKVLFVLGAIQFGLVFLVELVAAKNPTLNLFLSGVTDLLTVGLSATGLAVMYYRLRGVKESIDVDQISSVFA